MLSENPLPLLEIKKKFNNVQLIVVINKIDTISSDLSVIERKVEEKIFKISILNGWGIDELIDEIYGILYPHTNI